MIDERFTRRKDRTVSFCHRSSHKEIFQKIFQKVERWEDGDHQTKRSKRAILLSSVVTNTATSTDLRWSQSRRPMVNGVSCGQRFGSATDPLEAAMAFLCFWSQNVTDLYAFINSHNMRSAVIILLCDNMWSDYMDNAYVLFYNMLYIFIPYTDIVTIHSIICFNIIQDVVAGAWPWGILGSSPGGDMRCSSGKLKVSTVVTVVTVVLKLEQTSVFGTGWGL